MNITINKKKSIEDVIVIAKKAVEDANIGKAQVVAVFDISGSMADMYADGTVEALATRVLALAMQVDDNGEIPVYAFNESCRKVGDLTGDNLNEFISNKVSRLVDGGTNYAPAINKVVEDATEGDSMLVLFFTDGENYDRSEAAEAIKAASKLPIFFQFYGIYEEGITPSFGFLHKLDEMKGRVVDNAGFSPLGLNVVDKDSGKDGDKALYDDMLKEYKDFPSKAAKAGSTWANLKPKPRRRSIFGIEF